MKTFVCSGAMALLCALAACQGQIGQGATGRGTGSGGTTSTGTGTGTGATGVTTGTGGSGNVGTTGTGGAGTLPDELAAACARSNGVLDVGLTKVRRLTREQFDNTVRDLQLITTGKPSDGLAPDERIGPFYSNATAPITDLLVEQHQEMAKTLAAGAMSRMSQIAPCDLAADTGTTCANRFVTEFGLRAFRRPLTSTEVTAYVSLYNLGKTGGGASNGFRLVVEAMLQSPFFLYHHDVGAQGTPQTAPATLTQFELASRLSYFLWNSMPDKPLFDAAAANTLASDAMLTTQVERMLADARAAPTIGLFHRQWLALDELPNREKDPAVYPLFTPALADAMMQETAMFSDYVVRRGDGLLRTLLTSNLAFPQGPLFQVYGMSAPAGFTAGTSVALDGTQRAGILTQAAFLTRHAHRNQSAPVQRGLVLRENVMCQTIQPPPMNVNTTPPAPTPATTTRQRFEQHSADPQCSSCHSLMDPIGLGLESYDGVGAFRTMDGTNAVDARGHIYAGGADLDGDFNGAVELANKLAGSTRVSDCVVNQWFRFSLGRMESTNDACSIVAIRDSFRASNGNIRALLAAVALSPAFRNVRAVGN